MNGVQVVLSGFSERLYYHMLLCYVLTRHFLYSYGCMYFLAGLLLICIDMMMMPSAYAIT